MNQDSISFDLGTNFDPRLFEVIDQYDKKHSITSVFGKLRRDGLPGGRAAATIPDFGMDELEKYIQECKKRDIEFNYLINPLALDQNMLDPEVGKNIRDFIHTIYDIGIRAITLNSPALIHYVRKQFPDMFITLGLYAYPTKIHQIEYWRNWGVDEITLDHSFNRHFDTLRQLLTEYKDTDLHLRVIANNLCLRECPFRYAHGAFVGHSDPEKMSFDYALINCNYLKTCEPSRFLQSEWIRPEDIHYYRELAEETGNKHFSVKLVDRTRTTEFLTNVIRAYMEERYDGNLLDLVNWPQSKTVANAQKGIAPAGGPPVGGPPVGGPPVGGPPVGGPPVGGPPVGGPPVGGPPVGGPPVGGPPVGVPPVGGPPSGRPSLRYMESMKPDVPPRFGRVMNFPNIYIDNTKLDGFLEHFINGYRCDATLCRGGMTSGVADNFPNACGHCAAWAAKVISYDKEEVEAWKAAAAQFLSDYEDGAFYL